MTRPTPEGHRAPVEYRVKVLEGELDKHHKRLNAIRAQQIEAFGRDGQRGTVGQLRADREEDHAAVAGLRTLVEDMRRNYASQRKEVMLLMGGGSIFVGSVVALLINWLSRWGG